MDTAALEITVGNFTDADDVAMAYKLIREAPKFTFEASVVGD